MLISWNENKNKTNIIKHKISFELAQDVFDDPYRLSIQDRIEDDGEERWQTIGVVDGVVMILVAHTYTGDDIRIISARKASRTERRRYEEGIH